MPKKSDRGTVIRELTTDAELAASVDIIRQSFLTVADELGITAENWANYAGFITLEGLKEQQDSGRRFFGLFENDRQVGFVVVSAVEEKKCWFGKLAVLPDVRHKGYGRKLVEFAVDLGRSLGAERISLGLVEDNARLKRWYESLGFRTTRTLRPEGMNWDVSFMEKEVAPESPR